MRRISGCRAALALLGSSALLVVLLAGAVLSDDVFATLASCGRALEPLPRLSIDPQSISVSGLSSGADFAVQFQVAFSKTVMGLGVFAGQPFHCAVTRFPGDELLPPDPSVPYCEGCPAGKTLRYDHCKGEDPRLVDTGLLAAAARRLAAAGRIDDLVHLRRSRIYAYAGTHDSISSATQKTRDFFSAFVPAGSLLWNFTVPSGHAWPQDQGVNTCGPWPGALGRLFGNPWPAENCGYDGPGALLQHIYGPLLPPAERAVWASLRLFDQSPFLGTDPAATGLSQAGLLYVPRSCAGGARCRLHVMMHGCGTPLAVESVLAWSSHLGLSYNRWAEANGIVVLWPKVGRHGGPRATKQQLQGCWDGYGQTGPNYDTREGVQMRAVREMVEAISGVRMADGSRSGPAAAPPADAVGL